MPYISKQRRHELGHPATARSAGELNYLLTRHVHEYLRYLGTSNGRISYEDYNAAVGALESAKLELYRRFAVPYEDQKIAQNGDVTFHPEDFS